MSPSFHVQLQALKQEYERLEQENELYCKQLGMKLAQVTIPQIPSVCFPDSSPPGMSLPCQENATGFQLPGSVCETFPDDDMEIRSDFAESPSLKIIERVSKRKSSRQRMKVAKSFSSLTHSALDDPKELRKLRQTLLKTENHQTQINEEDDATTRLVILLDVIPALVIMANAVISGISADLDPDSAAWDYVETCFTTFFIAEILIKTKVFGCKVYFLGADWYWSWFDVFCVILALTDLVIKVGASTGGRESEGPSFGPLKMLKLARLGRIVRLLKFKIFAELKLMIQGVFTGLRVLLWAIVLLLLLLYLLGIIGRTLLSHIPEFNSVPAAMFTAFRCFTDGCSSYDGKPLQELIRQQLTQDGLGGLFMMLYILLFLFVTIGIFNLIMAVFIDNVNEGGVKKKQRNLGATAAKTEYKLTSFFRDKFMLMLENNRGSVAQRRSVVMDKVTDAVDAVYAKYGNKVESYDEITEQIKTEMRERDIMVARGIFEQWLTTDEELHNMLDEADIDLSAKYDLFDVLDADLSGELDFVEMIEGFMKCRGPVSKNDVISIRNKIGFLSKKIMQITRKLGCADSDDDGD